MKKFIKGHWLLIISLLYLIWPIDLIADVFGPVGLIDDSAILIPAIGKEIYAFYKSKKEKGKAEAETSE